MPVGKGSIVRAAKVADTTNEAPVLVVEEVPEKKTVKKTTRKTTANKTEKAATKKAAPEKKETVKKTAVKKATQQTEQKEVKSAVLTGTDPSVCSKIFCELPTYLL